MSDVLRWGRRFRLPGGARPAPQSGIWHEARSYRVLSDVALCPVQTFRAANPMIPGLIEPEGLPGQAKYLVSFASRRTLQPARDNGQRHMGRDKQVNMIRHDHPGVKFVKPSLAFARFDGVRHEIGNSSIFQPFRSGKRSIQFAILSHKAVSGPRVGFQQRSTCRGFRSVQPPCEEKRGIFGLKVRQPSLIFGHMNRLDGQAKPPAPPHKESQV